ncbi:MAG TPA: hypothetical protein VKH19_04900 [Gemmatimonadaceae bacterium]|nr:hypothetical protein [Gemmatimonadaceae bacterium]
MRDYLKLHGNSDDADPEVTGALRREYAPPSDESYWGALEARIVSRLADAYRIGWWDELDRWMRPALAAAAVVLLASGIALFRQYQAEQQTAYEAMLTPAPSALPVETAVRPVLQESRETTFRYLMTP